MCWLWLHLFLTRRVNKTSLGYLWDMQGLLKVTADKNLVLMEVEIWTQSALAGLDELQHQTGIRWGWETGHECSSSGSLGYKHSKWPPTPAESQAQSPESMFLAWQHQLLVLWWRNESLPSSVFSACLCLAPQGQARSSISPEARRDHITTLSSSLCSWLVLARISSQRGLKQDLPISLVPAVGVKLL